MRLMKLKPQMHTFPLTLTLLVLNGHLTSLTYNSKRRTWVRTVLLSLQVFNRKSRKEGALRRLMEVMTRDCTLTGRVLETLLLRLRPVWRKIAVAVKLVCLTQPLCLVSLPILAETYSTSLITKYSLAASPVPQSPVSSPAPYRTSSHLSPSSPAELSPSPSLSIAIPSHTPSFPHENETPSHPSTMHNSLPLSPQGHTEVTHEIS